MASKLVTVVAAQPFAFEGRAYRAGEFVTCTLVQALVLGRRGQVALDRAARPIYRTRDMVAAPVVDELAAVSSLPAAPARRRHRRRE
jgi:hypothetical protein